MRPRGAGGGREGGVMPEQGGAGLRLVVRIIGVVGLRLCLSSMSL